jgi:AcrR family transcriptional regulator
MKVPKQQRALETRAALLEAGRVAFAAKGLDGANLTTDILESAGVSAGSFYHQFEDKTDLLIAILDVAAERRKATVVSADLLEGLSLEEMLEQAVALFLSSLDERGHDWRLQIREWHSTDPRVRERIHAGRNSWREVAVALLAPYATEEGRLATAADVISVYMLGVMVRYFEYDEADRARAREELPRSSTEFLMGGLPGLLGG